MNPQTQTPSIGEIAPSLSVPSGSLYEGEPLNLNVEPLLTYDWLCNMCDRENPLREFWISVTQFYKNETGLYIYDLGGQKNAPRHKVREMQDFLKGHLLTSRGEDWKRVANLLKMLDAATGRPEPASSPQLKIDLKFQTDPA